MESSPNFNTEFTFKFDSIPIYESRFTFRIKPGIKDSAGNESKNEYVYRIFANGKYSKPPILTGLRMSMTPYNFSEPQFFFAETEEIFEVIPIKEENYPSGESIQTWIELYFITAEGALIDTFSVMELFRIETSNNVITFSPQQIKTSGFLIPAAHSGWEDHQRIEIRGNLVNSTNYGLINFVIGAGLKDNYGNKSEKPYAISVNK